MQLLLSESSREIAEHFGHSLDPSPAGVVTTAADGEIVAVNAAFADMLRCRPQDLVGKHLSFPSSQRSQQRYITADGADIWTNVTVSPIYGLKGAVEQFVWMFEASIDECPPSRHDAQREQAERVASLGRMASVIAHEFNNVLMGISPFVEVIRRGKSVETSLDHINRALKRGKRVTEDILRFTRPALPHKAQIAVEPWIEKIAAEARSLVPPSCRVETFVQCSDFVIDGDATQLQHVFMNLIFNARGAMPHGGTLGIEVVRERPNARLAFGDVEHPERFAHCIVRDTGAGMSPETLRHVFEPLFSTRKNGLGLGLSVAHQIVQGHGGNIFVESSTGTGTAVHLFLPLAM